ncbi:MAG: preprotein translocase subunit SecE [Propionibacteriaceae bacterium]|nr:preprotein translocase subunit SecE [Propionibacteriaceae bacterium]
MADKEEADSTDESSAPTVDPSPDSGIPVDGAQSFTPYRPGSVDPAEDTEQDPSEPVSADEEIVSVGEGELSEEPEGQTADEKDAELVPVGASAKEQPARTSGRKTGGSSALKKEKATAKQKQSAQKERRTGPVTFVRESVSELQKVVYPTGQQLINYFVVVLIFVLFIIAIVSLLDFAFGAAILKIFS